jgi:hypothetical protein
MPALAACLARGSEVEYSVTEGHDSGITCKETLVSGVALCHAMAKQILSCCVELENECASTARRLKRRLCATSVLLPQGAKPGP